MIGSGRDAKTPQKLQPLYHPACHIMSHISPAYVQNYITWFYLEICRNIQN